MDTRFLESTVSAFAFGEEHNIACEVLNDVKTGCAGDELI